jgi:transketolase N-terminal domain/subunit
MTAGAQPHLSKGHASPPVYSIYKAAGVVSDEELITEAGIDADGIAAAARRLLA